MESKTTKAQIKATKTWQENNRELSNYTKSKSACKSFIRTKATIEDLNDIIKLANEIKDTK